MEDIKKIYPLSFGFDDNIRDETERLRKQYSVPSEVMQELSSRGIRGVRWSDDKAVDDYVHKLEADYGDNFSDSVLGYIAGLMRQISNARERYNDQKIHGRFEKEPRPTMDDYLFNNSREFARVWNQSFKRTILSFADSEGRSAKSGIAVSFGAKDFANNALKNTLTAPNKACVNRNNIRLGHSRKHSMEVDGFYETIVYYDENGDQNENRHDHFKLGLDWWHRYQNRIGSVNIGGKYYLVTHCRKVDHPYVDEADRKCYEAHAVGVIKGALDYKVGYLVAHTGHSKVTTAFGEGDGGAKTASQLLDRRLKKSVVDTLIDSL